jgi:hypothetical protein
MDYYDMSEIAIKAARKREIAPVVSFVEQAIDIWESRESLLSRLSPLAGDFLDFKSDLISALSDGLIEGHGPEEADGPLKLLGDLTIPTSELDSLSELDPSGEFGEVQDYLRCLSRGEIFNEDLDTVWDFIIEVLEATQATVSLGDDPVMLGEPAKVS